MADYFTHPTADAELDKLESQGFSLPEKPKADPSLPDDLDDFDLPELMAQFSLFTSWADYANAQVGLAVISERAAERALEEAEAAVWKTTLKDNPKTPVSAVKASMHDVPSVRDAQAELDSAYAYRRLISDMAERYERDAGVLSRELTRRTQGEWNAKISRREKWKA